MTASGSAPTGKLGWSDYEEWHDHFKRHGKAVGAASLQHYLDLANDFLLAIPGITAEKCGGCPKGDCWAYDRLHECKRPGGKVARFNSVTHHFGSYRPGVYIATYYVVNETMHWPSESNMQYFHRTCLDQ